MAKEYLPVVSKWTAAGSYEATDNVDVSIGGTGRAAPVYFTVTENDTPPTGEILEGQIVEAGATKPLQLAAGDFLWLASTLPGNAAVEVLDAGS